MDKWCRYVDVYVSIAATVDRKIFAIQIIRILNFHIKIFHRLTVLQCSAYTHFKIFHAFNFVTPRTTENILTAKKNLGLHKVIHKINPNYGRLIQFLPFCTCCSVVFCCGTHCLQLSNRHLQLLPLIDYRCHENIHTQ